MAGSDAYSLVASGRFHFLSVIGAGYPGSYRMGMNERGFAITGARPNERCGQSDQGGDSPAAGSCRRPSFRLPPPEVSVLRQMGMRIICTCFVFPLSQRGKNP